jgi:serine/threonine-protein kinase ULK4
MAPELFEAGSVYSYASDLWALGCILYELSQGNPPFVSSSLHDIAALAKTG